MSAGEVRPWWGVIPPSHPEQPCPTCGRCPTCGAAHTVPILPRQTIPWDHTAPPIVPVPWNDRAFPPGNLQSRWFSHD